jgi:RecB family exonuclease
MRRAPSSSSCLVPHIAVLTLTDACGGVSPVDRLDSSASDGLRVEGSPQLQRLDASPDAPPSPPLTSEGPVVVDYKTGKAPPSRCALELHA